VNPAGDLPDNQAFVAYPPARASSSSPCRRAGPGPTLPAVCCSPISTTASGWRPGPPSAPRPLPRSGRPRCRPCLCCSETTYRGQADAHRQPEERNGHHRDGGAQPDDPPPHEGPSFLSLRSGPAISVQPRNRGVIFCRALTFCGLCVVLRLVAWDACPSGREIPLQPSTMEPP